MIVTKNRDFDRVISEEAEVGSCSPRIEILTGPDILNSPVIQNAQQTKANNSWGARTVKYRQVRVIKGPLILIIIIIRNVCFSHIVILECIGLLFDTQFVWCYLDTH